MRYIRVSEKDNGESYALYLGNTIEIELPENPTTGYIWEEESSDPSILQVDSTFVEKTKSRKKDPGKGGIRKIVVSAKKYGKAEVNVYLRRTWEQNEVPIKHFKVTVLVLV